MRIIIALLTIASVHALSLADYPGMFFTPEFNATIIIPDAKSPEMTFAANYLLTTLPQYTIRTRDTKTHATREHVRAAITTAANAPQHGPAIIIGTPCENEHTRRVIPTLPCTLALPPDQSRIILREGPTLVITAGTPALIPLTLRAFQEHPAQFDAQEIHFQKTNNLVKTGVYKTTHSLPYSIQNQNHSVRNDHQIRKMRYGTTIKAQS
ncbi:hypothetical protein C4580_01885 [Candidatus Woesearchaeota archaeon]|nr:MAG: hypothetical protein C4580_01885 [Candidatus Woesearchaeota archaeon]